MPLRNNKKAPAHHAPGLPCNVSRRQLYKLTQNIRDITGALETQIGVFHQTLTDNLIEDARDIEIYLRWARRLGVQYRIDQGRDGVALEWLFVGQDLVEYDSKREDIAATVYRLAA